MVNWNDDPIVNYRFYFSIQHIQSAALFAQRAGQIEQKYNGNFSNELLTEYWASITASIFAAVSVLEATINELFADSTEEHSEYPKNLHANTKTLMADMWNMGIPRTAHYPILEKFDIALILAKKPAFELGKQPAQDVDLVIRLRNSLIHYEPEWMSDDATASLMAAEKKLYKGLRGKFPTSPLWTGKNYSFFPNKCLSYGCAKWAVESSLAYSDEFYDRLGSTAPYNHIRQYLRAN